MRASQLLREYENGRRDFSGAYLFGTNLQDANLLNAELMGTNLQDAVNVPPEFWE